MGGDLIYAGGSVYVDFYRNNKIVHVKLDYFVFSIGHGYHIDFTDIDTMDSAILMELKKSNVKDKILKFIIAKHKGKKSKVPFFYFECSHKRLKRAETTFQNKILW